MTDQELIEALHRLDRPIAPSPAFSESLFVHLRQRVRAQRVPPPRLLLVAAVLTTAAVAGLIMAGVGSQREGRATASPAPVRASFLPYRLDIPAGVKPATPSEEVARALTGVEHPTLDLLIPPYRVLTMTWVPADTEYQTPETTVPARSAPYWVVEFMGGDGGRISLYVTDGALDVWGSDYSAIGREIEPTPPPAPPAPTSPLALVGLDGVTLTPTVLAIPGSDDRPSIGPLVAIGRMLWTAVWPVYQNESAYLLRVDTTSNDIRRVEIPFTRDTIYPVVFDGDVWLTADARLLRIDGQTGEVVVIVSPFAVGERIVGIDEFGVWITVPDGILLIDPDTGKERRRIETREVGPHAYRRIWNPPAFGSLWDYDRETGSVDRIDPETGEVIANIPVEAAVDHDQCGGQDLRPVTGVDGLPDVVVAFCPNEVLLIDPATNEFIGSMSIDGASNGVVVDGVWWRLRGAPSNGDAWDAPGTLAGFDASAGRDKGVFTFSEARASGSSPVVVDDALWFIVGQRAGPNYTNEYHQRLVRIPVAELTQ